MPVEIRCDACAGVIEKHQVCDCDTPNEYGEVGIVIRVSGALIRDYPSKGKKVLCKGCVLKIDAMLGEFI